MYISTYASVYIHIYICMCMYFPCTIVYLFYIQNSWNHIKHENRKVMVGGEGGKVKKSVIMNGIFTRLTWRSPGIYLKRRKGGIHTSILSAVIGWHYVHKKV